MPAGESPSHWEDRLSITRWDVPGVPRPDLASLTPADEAAARAAFETHRQGAKKTALKRAENSFLLMCEQLTGSKAKLGFGELNAIISTLPMEQQVVLGVRLLAIDAEAKREGGLTWWDDCAWHEEVAE